MADELNITDFLDPVNLHLLSEDEGFKEGQFGKSIQIFEEEMPGLDQTDLILLGCPEYRRNSFFPVKENGPDLIRREFYNLYYWHPEIRIADIGNIKIGATLKDTHAALKLVLKELRASGKTVLILGGTHDLTLAQYYSFADENIITEGVIVDALIDLDMDSMKKSESFLMEMLTGEPNFLKHYNHIGFQSYYVQPKMLETMDKLRFDCFRLGHVKENPEEMEPIIRNAHFFSFDISSIANAFAPANLVSPNGFTGEEACTLLRFAGLSRQLETVGIYGYNSSKDRDRLTARQISHMIWYYIDGKNKALREASLEEKDAFNEYHTSFAEVSTVFLQSKKTGRWWMQLPDQQFIACSYNDYLMASANEIPERWMRAQERS